MSHYDQQIEENNDKNAESVPQSKYLRPSRIVDYNDDTYLDYATEAETEAFLACRNNEHNQTLAAKSLGVKAVTLKQRILRLKAKAVKHGYSPAHNLTKPQPIGQKIKGVSTLYDKNGDLVMQWVKSSEDAEQQQEMIRLSLDAMAADLPRVSKTKYNGEHSDNLMAVYPLGDPHIGMLAWAEECGMDWDLQIAEKKFCDVFDRLVKTSPRCKEAVIVNLGDFFHADNMEGQTSRSKHALDMDGRYAKMVNVGIKIIRRMINSALEHHETVRVINAIGNHDDTGAQVLSISLANIYENEPRITIDTKPAPFHYFTWGKSLFGVHHGHSCKSDKLPLVMANDQAKLWGDSEYRMWLTGHIHHDSRKEYTGCDVESFRTLAAKDAYATWGGYRARQDSKCLVIHKEYGEIERHTVNLKMV